jgi:transposase
LVLKSDFYLIEETVTISRSEYEGLLALISELREEIRQLKNGRNSNTSHTPPSQDFGRSNLKNSRAITGRKTGGQTGHKGSTLDFKKDPDETISYIPNYCHDCGFDLKDVDYSFHERKQEVVIPTVSVKYIEHQSFSVSCVNCGCQNIGELPVNLTAPIQYGTSVSAVITYLSVYQYIPYNRIKKLMNDLFQLPISEGTIKNVLTKMTKHALPMYEEIQQRIAQSNIVGADETGTKINGKKAWFHVWQNNTLTFIVSSMNRGYATVETWFEKGFDNAIYVSDCWSAQLKVPAQKHQLCLAHLLRELKNFEDSFNCKWSLKLKLLFQKAIEIKKEPDRLEKKMSIITIESEFDELLNIDLDSLHKKQKAFVKRLLKNRDSVFVFLYHEHVPFDNNGSERAIRNVKVKNKISGSFRSQQGAYNFSVLRSVIDTTIKNSRDVFSAINLVAKFRPE